MEDKGEEDLFEAHLLQQRTKTQVSQKVTTLEKKPQIFRPPD